VLPSSPPFPNRIDYGVEIAAIEVTVEAEQPSYLRGLVGEKLAHVVPKFVKGSAVPDLREVDWQLPL
jgi:hypothetical protein